MGKEKCFLTFCRLTQMSLERFDCMALKSSSKIHGFMHSLLCTFQQRRFNLSTDEPKTGFETYSIR